MREVEKSKRLAAVAAFVRPGAFVADVGTDHGYLPIYLMEKGIARGAIAADVAEGPLGQAKKSVERFGWSDKIQVILSDGLQQLPRETVDDVIIAGMGGELIYSILEQGGWKDREKSFVLQPMTMEAYLRRKLWENGYEILQEQAVADGRHVYTVMQVRYTGEIKRPEELDCAIGKIEKKLGDGERYLLREKKRAADKTLRATHTKDEEMARYWTQAQEKIQKLLEERK